MAATITPFSPKPLLPSSYYSSSSSSSLFFPNHHPLTPPSSYPYPKSHPPNTSNYNYNNNTISSCSFPKTHFSSPNNSSETECPVPLDQQPINEYQALAESFPFSWASGDLVEYYSRLFATGAFFALFVGLPVSWVGSIGPKPEPIRLALGAASSGLFVAILAVVRMYLGWAYVGNRLFSATVEYEETGWYDGQIWVKTAQVLARDRLLGSFSVKPVLNRLKNSLVVLGTSLLICIVLLLINSENVHDVGGGEEVVSGGMRGRAIPGVYNDESARNFEADAFCGGEAIVP